jgi:serine/threonine protein kinase
VAVKMLGRTSGDPSSTATATTERALAELRDEAAVMCQLYHPHIARVYGIAVLGDGKGGPQRPQVACVHFLLCRGSHLTYCTLLIVQLMSFFCFPCKQALVMQYYRRGSLARAFDTSWYQDLSDLQRLRFGLQVRCGLADGTRVVQPT